MNLMTAQQAVKTGAVPMSLATIYKYHSMKQYPALFFRVHGRVMVDLDEYEKTVQAAKDKNIKRAEQARKI